ncbi:MAG TPA: GTP 3',8-cyclase MoaA [Flavobacteriales bacterium]|nr:GTP 3',8-cyclase MoaA [Flavobacteriales bacterium]HIN40610.1 GTP 3',8-cyclase MoaA [Flavobacteriales bacterium]
MQSLYDSFGRKHDYLRISLTERCNLRCTYCMPEHGVDLSPKDSLMTRDEILAITKVFVGLGVNKVRLTGGEPLVRKDFGEVLASLSKLNIELALTTNGILVDRYTSVFESVGLRSINISLDTLSPNKFFEITRKNDYHKVVSNIDLLLKMGYHIKLNVVVKKGFNDDEIIDFIQWTEKENIHIRFIEFMPFDGNSWNLKELISYKNILEKVREHYGIEKLNDTPNSTAKAFSVKGFKGTFAVISSMTDHFCQSCNRLRLTADGKMKNCLFSKGEVDILTPLRKGEDIEGLIRSCLHQKQYKHGGIQNILKVKKNDSKLSKRSMILIGG